MKNTFRFAATRVAALGDARERGPIAMPVGHHLTAREWAIGMNPVYPSQGKESKN